MTVYVLMRNHRMESYLLGVYESAEVAKKWAEADGEGDLYSVPWLVRRGGLLINGDYEIFPCCVHTAADEVPAKAEFTAEVEPSCPDSSS